MFKILIKIRKMNNLNISTFAFFDAQFEVNHLRSDSFQ